jgi:hypothetical protein
VFTSFVVGHVFESPQALFRVISTHYSSQLTKQVFGILGSLAIFGAPADFISNVGTSLKTLCEFYSFTVLIIIVF